MRKALWGPVAAFLLAISAFSSLAQGQASRLSFAVTPDPSARLFRVVLRAEGLEGEIQDLKLPTWMPGYYGLQDYPDQVDNFRAEDGSGRPLAWEKTTGNGWRVASAGAGTLVVSYDVKSKSPFVAHNYLDEEHASLAPVGVFMHIPGRLSDPVTVTLTLPAGWTVGTGLDRLSAESPTFTAPDFDTLYDCPMVMGKLDELPPFEIRGVPHYFVGYKLGVADPVSFMADLRKAVEAGIELIGEVPYRHYTFLGLGPGMGGIEHANSVAMGFSGARDSSRAARIRTMRFLAHEYFHNFNVKRIRPIALGPFDYDNPNLTRMLWVSDGFTSYYEELMLRRSGLTTPEELLDTLGGTIASYENQTGRLFQSATESSFQSWSQGPFGGRETGVKKTISYYDKGAVLGALLDFSIRHASENRESLDSVMRTLYRKYYKELGRGWTDEEFRSVCEAAAGVPLSEIFAYAETTRDVDYGRYLAFAGLELEAPVELPEPFLGAVAEDKNGQLLVGATEPDSPARKAGLEAGDEIKSVDGKSLDSKALAGLIAVRKPGETLSLLVVRAKSERRVDFVLGTKMKRSWKIRPISKPDPLQRTILNDWLKN